MNWRPAIPKDEPELAIRLYNAGWPGLGYTTEEMLAEFDDWPKRADRECFFGDQKGRAIYAAWMEPYWQPSPGRYMLVVRTEPDHEDLAEDGYRFLLDRLAHRAPTELKTIAFDVRPERGQLLETMGFSVLESQPFTQFEIPNDVSVPDCPLRLATIAELEREGFDWQIPLAKAGIEMAEDIPSAHPVDGGTIEESLADYQNELMFLREFMFVAVDGENIAAYTRIQPNRVDPLWANTAFTGTSRGYRRQGLARTVKLFSFARAYEAGIRKLCTDNLTNNPMYQINLDLGFKPWFRMDVYTKALNDD